MRLSSQSTAMSDPDDTSAERIFASICSPSALDRHAAATALSDLMEEKHSTEHHRRVGELISSAYTHTCTQIPGCAQVLYQ